MQERKRVRRASALIAMLAALTLPFCLSQDLPPEIQVDRLLVQAERETAEGNPWSAAYTLEQALQMYEEHGLEIPADFWIRYAQALQAAGLHEAAVDASTRYLQETGREGEHYQTALRLLDVAENDLAAARREQARRLAEAQRLAEEAAAREAAMLEAVMANLPDMVAIPAGTFRMGCVTGRRCEEWETPVREVRVPAFEISRNEVTFAQWDVCVEYGPCGWVPDEGWGRADRPVIHVSWHEARAYVSWISRVTGEPYRLPSEAEWEYAARAGTETRTIWGNSVRRNQANWDGDRTRSVGSYAANAFGLNDMFGNVAEWVEDCWHDNYRGAPSDGSAWVDPECSYRVWRGGSWTSPEARDLRASGRGGRDPDRSFANAGFRIARSLQRQGADAGLEPTTYSHKP